MGSIKGFQIKDAAGKITHTTLGKAAMIASGGLSGGFSSVIAGGDFWSGMRQGLLTAGLNHAMHEIANSMTKKFKFNVMLDEDGANGAGHEAISGELDNGKYRYLSLDGTADKTDANFSGKSTKTDLVFDTVKDIQKHYGTKVTPGHSFNKIDTYLMTRSQMNRAFNAGLRFANQNYNLIYNNCASIVTESLRAAYWPFIYLKSNVPNINQVYQRANYYQQYIYSQSN